MGKNRGWDYLNSSGDDFDFDEDNDGSWGVENDDGSGSYYGSDGSWGTKSSDGSGSFYGSDGSWGVRHSDGSSEFYGSDGSWGVRHSDGSSEFYGNDGSYESTDSDGNSFRYGGSDEDSYDDDDDSSSSETSDGASALGTLIGLGLAAHIIHKYGGDYSDIRTNSYSGSEYGRIIPPQPESPLLPKGEVWMKRAKARLFKHKGISVGYSGYSLCGKKGDEVYAILYNCGFKRIRKNILKDIYVDSHFEDDEVEKVEINGQTRFSADDLLPYDADVTITIHKKREITIPFSSSSLKRLNYTDVCSRIASLGFTEIYTSQIKDLVTGWLTKDGSVEKVVINDSESFKKNSVLKYDVTITVHYHTFKNK